MQSNFPNSFKLPYKFKEIKSEFKLDVLNLFPDPCWIVWMYCGIRKNDRAKSQPMVLVAFRKFSKGYIDKNQIYNEVSLSYLGKLRVGTVWQKGICIGEIQFEKRTFNLDFSDSNRQFESFEDADQNLCAEPYPQRVYPLEFAKDKNFFLSIPLPSGGKLTIPCLEYFLRCYGSSAELKRVLVAYPWNPDTNHPNNRLYSPLWEPEEEGKWKVVYKKRLNKSDSVILAHAKYDKNTEKQLKLVYSQVETSFNQKKNKPIFIKVGPWFQGPASITVRGIPFDRNSFLGLQIVEFSEPDGLPIFFSRELTSSAAQSTSEGDLDGSWMPIPRPVIIQPDQEVVLTDYDEPDNNSPVIEVLNPEIQIIGKRRKLIQMLKPKIDNSSEGSKFLGPGADRFASGESYGSSKGVGYVAIHTPFVYESYGILYELWATFIQLQRSCIDRIATVDWFSFKNGFDNSGDPEYIGLKPFAQNENVSTEIRNWLFLEKKSSKVRGALLIRIVIDDVPIYFFEIQRKVKIKFKEMEPEHAEDALTGMIFKLNEQHDLDVWLKELLSGVRHTKGVLRKFFHKCPGKAAIYRHRRSQNDDHPFESAIINALSKLNINLNKI